MENTGNDINSCGRQGLLGKQELFHFSSGFGNICLAEYWGWTHPLPPCFLGVMLDATSCLELSSFQFPNPC